MCACAISVMTSTFLKGRNSTFKTEKELVTSIFLVVFKSLQFLGICFKLGKHRERINIPIEVSHFSNLPVMIR